jgi:putative oxidoreductase
MKLLPILILRIVVGGIFFSHGIARLYYMSIPDFAEFLNSKGLLIGTVLAWAITIGEIVFGTMLAIGYKARIAIVFNALVVLGGIILIHYHNGWFVVGHGSNGMEFSLLLLAVLVYLFFQKGKLR